MKQDPRPSQLEISDFVGLMTNADGSEVPASAAQRQTNFMSNRLGEITSRPGIIECVFEDEEI